VRTVAEWSSKNPYFSTVTTNHILNGEGSKKETRHLVFELGESGLEYKAGDALGIIPTSPPELVDDIIGALGANGTEMVESHVGNTSFRMAMLYHFEIHQAKRKFIVAIGEKFETIEAPLEIRLVERKRTSVASGDSILNWAWSGDDDDFPPGYSPAGSAVDPAYQLWSTLMDSDEEMENYLWGRDLLDVLDDFGHLGFSPQEFVNNLDRLKPRLYSIASSPDHEPGTVHLTVAIVRYEGQGRAKSGLCTGFLADRRSAPICNNAALTARPAATGCSSEIGLKRVSIFTATRLLHGGRMALWTGWTLPGPEQVPRRCMCNI